MTPTGSPEQVHRLGSLGGDDHLELKLCCGWSFHLDSTGLGVQVCQVAEVPLLQLNLRLTM